MSLVGAKELSEKLSRLGKAGKKTLRSAALKSTTPTMRKMRQKAPVGDEPHRTYKGRTVAPGFLKRSLRRRTKFRDGKASVIIGVRSEAFYGVQFLDRGTTKMRARRWFESTFVADRSNIEKSLVNQLRVAIKKAT